MSEHSDVWVCVDCYFSHHYGATERDGQWYAGESDTPSDREPLSMLEGYDVADNTHSETGEGIDEFSWSSCEGCGSTLGGSRYRLALVRADGGPAMTRRDDFRASLERLGADTYARADRTHYHVASGLAGYGPDAADSDGFPTFETLADALEYARDELATYIDMAHEAAHAFGDAGDYESAWNEVLRCETLETLRANLDPARRSTPLYADDPPAYAALQESQAGEFPHDVSHNARLYLWPCSETECVQPEPDESDGYVNEPAYGSCVVSLDSRVIGTTDDVEEGFRMLARAMEDSAYWPNCWHVNERGNTTLVSLDSAGGYTFTDTAYV